MPDKKIVLKRAGLQDLLFERWLRRRNEGALVWTKASGESVPIKDMSDEHLNNAIAMLERSAEMQEHLADYEAAMERN